MLLTLLTDPPQFRSVADLLPLGLLLFCCCLIAPRLPRRLSVPLALLVATGLLSRFALYLALLASVAVSVRAVRRAAPDRTPPPGSPLLIAAGLLLSLLLVNGYLNDGGDAWWWLNTGRTVAQHGIITQELFTASIPGTYAAPQEWLSAFFAYRLFAIGGWPALRVTSLFCLVFPFLLLVRARRHRGLRSRVPDTPLLAVACVAAAWLLRDEFAVRAVTSIVPCFALAWLLPSLPLPPWRLTLLYGLLVTLWANCHLSFFLALIFPLAQIAAALTARRRPGRAPLLLLAAALVAPALHPLGFGIWGALASMLTTQGTQILDVFLPPAFADAAWWPALLWVALTLAGLGALPRSDRFAIAALLVAFLAARRNLLFFVIVSVPAVTAALASLLPVARHRAAAALLLAGALLVAAFAIPSPLLPLHPLGHAAQDAAFAWLADHVPDGEAVLNYYALGGRLGWHAYPQRLVFIDGRNHLFEPAPVWDDYLTLHFVRDDFDRVLAHHGFRFALFPDGNRVTHALRARGWQTVLTAGGISVLRAP